MPGVVPTSKRLSGFRNLDIERYTVSFLEEIRYQISFMGMMEGSD